MKNYVNIMEATLYGHGHDYKPKAGEPTDEVPGTKGKLDVLVARAQAGVSLWHPDDATDYEDASHSNRAKNMQSIPAAGPRLACGED